MRKEQYDEMMDFIEEHIVVEDKEGLKPRFKDFKRDILSVVSKGKTFEYLDWETLDSLLTEKHKEFLKDYAVAQVRKNGN